MVATGAQLNTADSDPLEVTAGTRGSRWHREAERQAGREFAYLATHRKLFRTLYLVREPMSLPRHLADDEDVLLNVTDEVGSWRLFADSLEELCIKLCIAQSLFFVPNSCSIRSIMPSEEPCFIDAI